MGRDPHRAPGRLVPLRPDHERGTPALPPLDHPSTSPPTRQDRSLPAPLPPDEEETLHQAEMSRRAAPAAPPPDRPDPVTPPPDRSAPAADHVEDEPPWTLDDTQPRPRVTMPLTSEPSDAAPGTLSIQERHQLLIHTISLYEDEWRLAGIRANPKNNWLQAFLVPRGKQLDLKEAISKNQALIITIDPRGNTEIREPKKTGPLKKITTWLIGE